MTHERERKMTSANGSLIVVKAARLIDCTDGSTRENMAVVVENGRIARVSPQHELAFPEGARPEVHDFGDASLLPGLIDCHTHTNMRGDGSSVDDVHEDDDDIHLIQGVKSARLAIESGVTTMRENGGWNRTTFSLKEGIRRGLVPGPRIVNCGRPITMTGGHCWMMGSQADGVDGVRKEVRRLVAEGADYIKVMSSGGSTRNSVPTPAANIQRAGVFIASFKVQAGSSTGAAPVAACASACWGLNVPKASMAAKTPRNITRASPMGIPILVFMYLCSLNLWFWLSVRSQ